MASEHRLVVRAAGKQLDLLRGEAFRIAKASQLGWSTDRADVGTLFCFEDAKAKNEFAVVCYNFGVPSKDI